MSLQGDQKYFIVSLFEDIDTSYNASYLRRRLRNKYGYLEPNRIIRDAINEGILIVDTLAPLFLALSPIGVDIWRQMYE